MRSFLSVVIIWSLTLPAFAEGLSLKRITKTQGLTYSPIPPSSPTYSLAPQPSCEKNPRRFLFGETASQSNLLKLFENMSCSNASNVEAGESLDKIACESVRDCKSVLHEKEPMSEKESGFLKVEALNFVVRENIRQQMSKYKSTSSSSLREMLAFIEKMPEENRKAIKSCGNYKKESTQCLSDGRVDLSAKAHIVGSFYKGINDAVERLKMGLTSRTDDVGAKKFEQKIERANKQVVETSGQLLDSVAKNADIESDFKEIKFAEEKNRQFVQAFSNDLAADKDAALDVIVKEVIEKNANVSKISGAELRVLVKKALHKYAGDGKDYIFGYISKSTMEHLDKSLDRMDFVPEDFTASNRLALSKKINDLRVQVANGILAEDCDKTVVSIGQLCANVSDSLKSGKASDQLIMKDDNIFSRIIDSYMLSDLGFKQDKIEELQRMSKAENNVYERYLKFMLKTNTCEEKFPELFAEHSKESEAFKQNNEEIRSSTQALKAMAAKGIQESIKSNEHLRQEFSQSGYKFKDTIKPEILAVDSSFVTKKEIEPVSVTTKSSENANNTKMYLPEQNVGAIKSQAKMYDVAANEQNDSFEEFRKSRESSELDQKLRSKLSELESKEKALAKKMTQPEEESAPKDAQQDELQSLRKQIEELKNLQNNKSTPQVAGVNEVARSVEKSDNSNGGSEAKNTNFLGNRNGQSAAEIVDRGESIAAVKGVAQAAASSADYQPEVTANASASKPTATAGASALSGSKVGLDKSIPGITLTKSGEVVLDPANVLDNPNEGEIINLIEQTNGQPFLIRENGELIKVTVLLDAKGKPVVASNGKMKFKKVRLSKEQQKVIAKEVSKEPAVKTMKEVGPEPTRLFKLRTLINEKVQRE